VLLFSNVLSIPNIYAEQNYTPKELNISIYADGVVEVEYKLEVELTLARVKITPDGYSWSRLLKRINKYGQFLYEAYWYEFIYSGKGCRSISRGKYKVETKMASRIKKSLK